MYLPSIDFIITSADNLIVVPIFINYFVRGNSKLELGAGIIFVSIDNISVFGIKERDGASSVAGRAVIGYRYQSLDCGFLFRILA